MGKAGRREGMMAGNRRAQASRMAATSENAPVAAGNAGAEGKLEIDRLHSSFGVTLSRGNPSRRRRVDPPEITFREYDI